MSRLRIDVDQARTQLELLGYKPGDNVYMRFFVPDGDPRHGTPAAARKANKLNWEEVERYQNDGYGVYFVVNGGGHTDKDVQQGRSLFCEWDDRPIEDQLFAWQNLNLPEPSLQVGTRKSVHNYWRADLNIEQWIELQEDLLAYTQSDQKLKNPSRVLRLAGAYHIKPDCEPVRCDIIHQSDKVFAYDELRFAIPRRIQPESSTIKFSTINHSPSINDDVPLYQFLTKDDRALIDQGAGQGSRNNSGAKLARNLIGTRERLNHLGIRFGDDPRHLFHDYCYRCTPSLSTREAEAIWKSALKDNPTPSLSDDALENCAKAWQRNQGREVSATTTTSKKPETITSSTEGLLKCINELIDKELSESELQHELIQLSKQKSQPFKDLWTLHNALAQEKDRSSILQDSLPQLEKLIQYEAKKDIEWEAILPSPLFKALKTKADADRIDPIFLIQSLLPAIGGLIGSGTGIVCKEGETVDDHWIEYPILWTTIIAQPSAGKSNADRAIFNPILKMQNAEADRYERDKTELARLEKQWERESKDGKAELFDTLDNPANFREGMSPARKFFIDEGEIEAVKRRISEQSPSTGITWNSDELLSIFNGLDQYKHGRGNGRQFLLKAWNSPLSGYVDRVNESESFRFKGQCLSLCGGIQVKPAAQFFNPDGQNLDEDGLRSRVLVAIPQLHAAFDEWNDTKVSLNILLTDLYKKVQKIPKGLIYLSPEASKRWHKQWEKYRKGLRQNTSNNPAFAYFLGKMCSNLMRLALVLHSIEHCYTPKFDFFLLDDETMSKAIKMADYYITQFRLAQSMFTSCPDQGMGEFLLNILNLCLKEGSLAPYQVVDRYRRHKGKHGKAIRAAEVKEMFLTIAQARPQQVTFDGKKLFALEKTRSGFSENTYKTRSPDRANKPLQDVHLDEKHDRSVHFLETKSENFDDFSSPNRSCLYGKHPQTIATPTENGTIARSCSDRVLENPIVFSEPPLTRGEQAEPAYNRVQVSVVQGLEGTSSSLDAMEEPDRVSEKPDRVSEKPDRVSGKKDCAFAEIQIGKLAKVCADIPSLEPLNGRQGVIDLIGSGVCRLQFVDGGDFHYVPHRYLIVTGEGEITEPIQSLVFSDKISTKTGSRRGRVSKVRRFRNGIEKYEITWDTEEIITYTIEEMQVAGFMKIKRKVSNEG